MATPHAAGLCALLLQANPQLTPDAIRTRMMSTSVNLGFGPNAQGAGQADAWEAIKEFIANPPSPAPNPVPNPKPTPQPSPGQPPLLGCLPGLAKLLIRWPKRR
jgi:subtilisin family serine protease